MSKTPHVLYLSYDGLLEPLGESQVLNYVLKMAESGEVSFSILSYEKPGATETERFFLFQQKMARLGIHWVPMQYHRRPAVVSTLWDVSLGIKEVRRLNQQRPIDLIHSRSYVATLIALYFKRVNQIPFIFDMRGFWADEKVESGQWPRQSAVYKVTKRCEKLFFEKADHIVSLTQSAVDVMKKHPSLKNKPLSEFSVIPTCADLEKFTLREKGGAKCIGYVGSAVNWYDFPATAVFFAYVLKRIEDSKILIVNQSDHQFIKHTLESAGADMKRVEILAAHHGQMPELIKKMDFTVFFIKPTYAKKASSPTKWAEFLASGVPCITGDGIGDMTEIIKSRNIGVVHLESDTTESSVSKMLKLLDDPHMPQRCRQAAEELFSLEAGADRYQQIYRQTLGRKSAF